MSDYFARAAARADPPTASVRPAAPALATQVAALVDEAETLEADPTTAATADRGSPVAAQQPAPLPWPMPPWEAGLPATWAPPKAPVPPVALPLAPDPAPESPAGRPEVQAAATWPLPTLPSGDDDTTLPPVPGPAVDVEAAPVEGLPPAEPLAPPAVQVDPLALADAVLARVFEPPASVVPPPEPPADNAPDAGSAAPVTVVIDRLTVELVDDRPAVPAPPPRRTSPRPSGRLTATRRFDSGWGS